MNGPEFVLFLIMFIGGFLLVFGIYYLKSRQNMAMIERNMNPKNFVSRPAPYRNLKWALLLIGAGAGLFVAYLLDYMLAYNTNHWRDDNPAIYFSLIAIGGGLGLFGSYKMEKKWWDENKDRDIKDI